MSLWTQNAEVKISGHSACRERNVRGNAAGAICCYHDWLLCSAVLRCATLAAVGGGVHQLLCFWHRVGEGDGWRRGGDNSAGLAHRPARAATDCSRSPTAAIVLPLPWVSALPSRGRQPLT